MTKKIFLEILQKRLKQIDETNTYGIQYLEGVADLFWQQHAMNHLQGTNGDVSFFSKRYYAQKPKSGRATGYYLSLPAPILKLPQVKNSIGSDGVLSIFYGAYPEWVFSPVRERDFKLIKTLPIYELVENEFYYYVNFDKIFFSENLTSEIINNGVVIDLLIPFSSYAMTEDIPIPTDMNNVLFLNVINLLTGQQPADLLNNNA